MNLASKSPGLGPWEDRYYPWHSRYTSCVLQKVCVNDFSKVNGDLDFDAASALREGKKKFERENIVARNAMSTLSLGTGESASERSRGGSVLSSSYKY